MFVGQVARDMMEREAFQEVDYKAVFGTIAKWVVEITDAARMPELISRAFHVAMQGRPGPVVVSLPEDMLIELAEVADAAFVTPVETYPGQAQLDELQKLLGEARRPIALVGGSRWSAEAVAQFGRFAERFRLPVANTFRRQMLFPADHACFAGDLGIGPNPKLLERVKQADLVLLVGGRLSEMASQSYTLFGIPEPGRKLVHVHPSPEELGRVYHPTLGINAAPTAFAAALDGLAAPNAVAWDGEADAAHAAYLAWSTPAVKTPGKVQMGEVMAWLEGQLPPDAILTNGAGNYAGWLHRFHRFLRFGTQLAPTSGSMGYGLPAAVGAKRHDPTKTVVCFAGDGCFMMHGQEFATAVQYDLPILVLLIDNGMYGTIRMHQERDYPGRVSGTQLRNPDFAAYARAFGGHGETVEDTAEFMPAFERARASGKPAIVHIKLDPEVITTATTLSAIREKALAAAK
jgi:acetolactate synthase-1/2/3 large subunit